MGPWWGGFLGDEYVLSIYFIIMIKTSMIFASYHTLLRKVVTTAAEPNTTAYRYRLSGVRRKFRRPGLGRLPIASVTVCNRYLCHSRTGNDSFGDLMFENNGQFIRLGGTKVFIHR